MTTKTNVFFVNFNYDIFRFKKKDIYFNITVRGTSIPRGLVRDTRHVKLL